MAPRKRKASQVEEDTASVPKRGRGRPARPSPRPTASSLPKGKPLRVEQTASSSRPKRKSPTNQGDAKITRSSKTGGVSRPTAKTTKSNKITKATTPVKPKKATKAATKTHASGKKSLKDKRDSSVSVEIPEFYTKTPDRADEAEADEDPEGPACWLMKAEPESRVEKGKDVKFSIDDLKNAIEPEAWDGKLSDIERF